MARSVATVCNGACDMSRARPPHPRAQPVARIAGSGRNPLKHARRAQGRGRTSHLARALKGGDGETPGEFNSASTEEAARLEKWRAATSCGLVSHPLDPQEKINEACTGCRDHGCTEAPCRASRSLNTVVTRPGPPVSSSLRQARNTTGLRCASSHSEWKHGNACIPAVRPGSTSRRTPI